MTSFDLQDLKTWTVAIGAECLDHPWPIATWNVGYLSQGLLLAIGWNFRPQNGENGEIDGWGPVRRIFQQYSAGIAMKQHQKGVFDWHKWEDVERSSGMFRNKRNLEPIWRGQSSTRMEIPATIIAMMWVSPTFWVFSRITTHDWKNTVASCAFFKKFSGIRLMIPLVKQCPVFFVVSYHTLMRTWQRPQDICTMPLYGLGIQPVPTLLYSVSTGEWNEFVSSQSTGMIVPLMVATWFRKNCWPYSRKNTSQRWFFGFMFFPLFFGGLVINIDSRHEKTVFKTLIFVPSVASRFFHGTITRNMVPSL